MFFYILCEPRYSASPWCKSILNGLENELNKRRLNFTFRCENDILESESGFAFLIGNNENWIEDIISKCTTKNIHPIVLSSQSEDRFIGRCSCVTSNLAQSLGKILGYFRDAGKISTALFGVNEVSLSNMTLLDSFKNILGDMFSDDCVFYNRGSIDECCKKFISNIDKYDSVICVNDFASIKLIKMISKAGKELPVISYGGSIIARNYYKNLMTVSMGYESYGRAAMNIYDILKSSDDLEYIRLTVKCKFDERILKMFNKYGDTSVYVESSNEHEDIRFYSDDSIIEMFKIENMLSMCDDIDFMIITHLFEKESYETIAEKLFCSVNTIKYRVKKMKENSGYSSKDKMMDVIKEYCGL